MKIPSVAALFVSSFLAVPAMAIYGGRVVPLAENPSEVGIESRGDVVPSPVMKCSATKIGPRTYLTASHCFELAHSNWAQLPEGHERRRHVVITLHQGTANDPSQWPPAPSEYREVTTEVLAVYAHPQARNEEISSTNVDAAIFTVERDFDDAPAARLASRAPERGQRIAFAGYGRPDHLKCLLGDSRIERVLGMQFSLQKREDWQSLIGINDSGGAVFSLGHDGKIDELIGINSWQRARVSLDWRNRDISFHVRVDRILDWIERVKAGAVAPDYQR